jgi:hypothetical protein
MHGMQGRYSQQMLEENGEDDDWLDMVLQAVDRIFTPDLGWLLRNYERRVSESGLGYGELMAEQSQTHKREGQT